MVVLNQVTVSFRCKNISLIKVLFKWEKFSKKNILFNISRGPIYKNKQTHVSYKVLHIINWTVKLSIKPFIRNSIFSIFWVVHYCKALAI